MLKQSKLARRVGCALLLALLVFSLAGCGAKETAASGATTNRQAVRGDLVVGLTADGTVALPVTNLNFEVEGTIKAMHVAAFSAWR
jgi:hypothetical protein